MAKHTGRGIAAIEYKLTDSTRHNETRSQPSNENNPATVPNKASTAEEFSGPRHTDCLWLPATRRR